MIGLVQMTVQSVSIPAPLARSNDKAHDVFRVFKLFQYLLLLRGATHMPARSLNFSPFQYLLLLRGATRAHFGLKRLYRSFNTCSSCEEQLPPLNDDVHSGDVSIPAPLARSNTLVNTTPSTTSGFNTCSSCEEQLIVAFVGTSR